MTQAIHQNQILIGSQQQPQFLKGLSLFSTCCALQNTDSQFCSGTKLPMNKSGLVKNKSLNSFDFKLQSPQSTNKKEQKKMMKQNSYKKLSIKDIKTKETNFKQMKHLLFRKQQKQLLPNKKKLEFQTLSTPQSHINKNITENKLTKKTLKKSIQKPHASAQSYEPVSNERTINNNQRPTQYRVIYPIINQFRIQQPKYRFPERRSHQVTSPFYQTIQSQPRSPIKISQYQTNYFTQGNRFNSCKFDKQTCPNKKIQADEQFSEKTEKKFSCDDQSGIYHDLKNISIANSAQLQGSDKYALNDFIKEKLKQSDLKQTRKQSYNPNPEKSSNQEFLQKLKFPLIQSQQIKTKNAHKKEQDEKIIEKEQNSEQNFKKINKPISPFFPQTAMTKSKISPRGLNEQDKFSKQPIGYALPSNINSGRPFSNKVELSSLTVRSYLQSIQQSKIVQKVQQSMVMLDFFNPPTSRNLLDSNRQNYQSTELDQ